MSPMHFAAADRLVAEQRAAHEAAAARGRLRRLVSRRHRSAPRSEPEVESPVALTLASYRVAPAPRARMRPVA